MSWRWATQVIGRSAIQQSRFYTSNSVDNELRTRLLSSVKTAMKNKDVASSTTIRSVLSEVNAADKAANSPVTSSTIIRILRKAVCLRHEAAAQYTNASRLDLAEKEVREANLLNTFVPDLLSVEQIDNALNHSLQSMDPSLVEGDPRKHVGLLLKHFYSKVDKSLVDTDTVKKRAIAIMSINFLPH